MATKALLTNFMATTCPWYLAVLVNICWPLDISVFILIEYDRLVLLVSFKNDDLKNKVNSNDFPEMYETYSKN